MTNMETILNEAHEAAKAAVKANAHKENPNAFDCGFAWVTIDGMSPLARHCRKAMKASGTRYSRYLGDKGYPKGWQFWCPGEHYGQSIAVHKEGARAFRDALAQHGISATVGFRLD